MDSSQIPNGSWLTSWRFPANQAAIATANTKSSCVPERALKLTRPASETLRLKSFNSSANAFASARARINGWFREPRQPSQQRLQSDRNSYPASEDVGRIIFRSRVKCDHLANAKISSLMSDLPPRRRFIELSVLAGAYNLGGSAVS